MKNTYFYESFKNKIGEPVSGGTVHQGTFTKLGHMMNDSQIISKFNIEPLSIPDFWATIENMIDTLDKKAYGYLFYIKADDGRTITLDAFWDDERWKFNCGEFGEDGVWGDEQCVFSSATPLKPSTPSPSETMTLESAIEIVKQAGLEVVGQITCETCNGTGKVEIKK